LQSAQAGVNEGWIFGEELRPVRAEELPPNEFFFDKKRKAVVKREFYQEGESTAKRFKIMTDGMNRRKDEFATEIAGTLGAYATANQFSVEGLKRQLKTKNRLIKTLEARVTSAEENARSQVSGEIELARLGDKQEIQALKAKLEQANSTIRDGRLQSGQLRDTITRLQAQLEVTESRAIRH
jgi:predicted  nucleic acid-binding Zn-ribbon protein